MSKILAWIHALPAMPQLLKEEQLLEQIIVSAFQSDTGGQNARQIFRGNFKDFSDFIQKPTKQDGIDIILPAKDVLYTRVSVPSKSRNRILQALPFIIEDEVINDINSQFIALGEMKNGHCNIAVVNRSILHTIYAQFKKLAIPLSRISSEIFLLPWHTDKWSMTIMDNKVYIRTGAQAGLVIDAENIDFAFNFLLKSSDKEKLTSGSGEANSEEKSEEHTKEQAVNSGPIDKAMLKPPESIIVYVQKETELTDKINRLASDHSISFELEKSNLLKLALSAIPSGINLLQGEFSPDKLKSSSLPFKWTLITMLVLWLVSQVVFMGYQWHLNKNQLASLETSLEQLYFQTFPESKRLIDVRAQAESKYQQLQARTSSSDSFLALLGVVGDKLRHFKDVRIKTLHYNEGILQMDVQSKGFFFNDLKKALQDKKNIIVQEKSSSRIEGEVHSTLIFRLENSL